MTPQAFAALYDAHVGIVRAVLFRLCPRPQLDDLTQEVFLRAWRGQAGFRGQATAKTWLISIARHVAVDALRAGKSAPSGADGSALDRLAAPAEAPGDRGAVQRALAMLAPDDQVLMVLTAVEGCTVEEVGEVLGIPAGTVKSRAFHLRQRLRERLEDGSKDPEVPGVAHAHG